MAQNDDGTLFPRDLPEGEWQKFAAHGYTEPVCGLVRRRRSAATSGMPLGGIDTGAFSLETDGTLGYCTIFNSIVPMRGPLRLPFLGMSVGDQSWILTTDSLAANESWYSAWGGTMGATPSEISYWGHFPVTDMEYAMAGSPVTVGVRAWSPFIPGDAAVSNTPGAVFEVHLRNVSDEAQTGRLAFSFPGPTQEEAQIAHGSPRRKAKAETAPGKNQHTWLPVAESTVEAQQEDASGDFSGVVVTSSAGNNVGYALGIVGEGDLEVGGALGRGVEAWRNMGKELPTPEATDFGRTVTVAFDLAPGETRVVRFVLAWYAPVWIGEADHDYMHMYTTRFDGARAVAEYLARDHEVLLRRVLGWQQALYTAEELPDWLRECLVNILHLFPINSLWAVPRPPIGDWCRPEDGLFGLISGIIDWPDMEVMPDVFYSNPPLVFFFPELALSTLRGYKAYQFRNGAAPWQWGGATGAAIGGFDVTAGTDMANPSPGFQTTTNGPCYVDMVDRYIMRTGDEDVLREFYDSIKRNTTYTMGLRPEDGDDGLISVPSGNVDPYNPGRNEGMVLEWFEAVRLFGMVTHVGGIHMANMVTAERMAERMDDHGFAQQCRDWFEAASRSMEDKMWTGTHYYLYNEPSSQKSSDLVFGYQLDGQWMARFHGCRGTFPDNRVKTTLDTIRRTCGSLSEFGAINLATPDGGLPGNVGYGPTAFFIPENDILGATYMYEGERDYGLELIKRCQTALNIEWGYTWDQPNVIRGDSGQKTLGTHLTQNMLLWCVPAAALGQDVTEFCAPGGVVDRIIEGGRG